MRRLVWLISAVILAGCGSRVVATSPSVPATPTVERTSGPSASAQGGVGNQDAVMGPAGMTLEQEVGAVMMVGFTGPLTPAVLEDWRQHQFGALIVVPSNRNAADSAATRQLIQSVRGVMLHPLMAAADSAQPSMFSGLKALGFDIAFFATAADVTAVVAGIHAAGMYAAARDFPGDGNRDVTVRAAIAAHVEFIMVGQVKVPSIAGLGYQGVIISDDLQSEAQSPPPAAAVRFFKNGGDMVIVSHDIAVADATYAAIHAAVLNGSYPRAKLDASVQKLLSLGLRYMP
jgi:beta-glucosidase-like glycosyl hydrolase